MRQASDERRVLVPRDSELKLRSSISKTLQYRIRHAYLQIKEIYVTSKLLCQSQVPFQSYWSVTSEAAG